MFGTRSSQFQEARRFQRFQRLAEQDYRRARYLANGQERLFWMILRFLASNSLR